MQSSANIRAFEFRLSGRSLMKIKNKTGLNTEPWGHHLSKVLSLMTGLPLKLLCSLTEECSYPLVCVVTYPIVMNLLQ